MGSLENLGKKYGKPVPVTEEDMPTSSIVENNSDATEDDGAVVHTNEIFATTPINPASLHNLKSMSWIRINKIIQEKDVALVDCLSVIYIALSHTAQTIALVIKKSIDGKINLYLGVRDKDEYKDFISKYILQKSISGTIPGVAYTDEQFQLSDKEGRFVSATIGVASLKGEKKEKFIQGIERVINAAYTIPTYTALFLAENKSSQDCENEKDRLEEQYSELSKSSEITVTKSDNTGSSITETNTIGENTSNSNQKSTTVNQSKTQNESTADSRGSSNNTNIVVAGEGTSYNTTTTTGTSTTTGSSKTSGETATSGTNSSKATANGETRTVGTSEQVKRENKHVKNVLKELDTQINKFNGVKSLGLWDFSSYFIADTKTSALGLSCLYRGLIVGKDNESEKLETIVWEDEQQLDKIWEYLKDFKHPIFNNGADANCFTAVVNSRDLAICMSLPHTSVPGVLVKEIASFGRNITYSGVQPDAVVELGQIVHMGQISAKDKVALDENLLTSHTFITGSTGCGKSNTLYLILQELLKCGKKVLVIEPAKGEYKNVIGQLEDVKVLGTNPNISKLLHINPFSFPKDIHVEEHIDRLIDIFNACWPMYAAMPAVLKQSISNAYVSCGWDMLNSTTDYEGLFPTFADVIRELQIYINSSEYSQDSKGDYKGALETRLNSLTNGIIGQIFSGETPMEDLFNTNTVVDLSRVGSLETKSLIMGMLILKLNEFRMSENIGMNLPLRHVTVLEEAHNLLRSSSSTGSPEGVNLMGKSVEMIASAIAEMRTYGEGFIIADQSPSLLDRAVISNTNTKIIMNLPNKVDREIACTSIGLDEIQEKEVSRLQTGTAVVHQQGWEEPVLCRINKFEFEQEGTVNKSNNNMKDSNLNNNSKLFNVLYNGFANGEMPYKSELVGLLNVTFSDALNKKNFIDIIRDVDEISEDDCAKLFVAYIGVRLFELASKEKSLVKMNILLEEGIRKTIGTNDGRIDTFVSMYVKGCSIMNAAPFYEAWLVETNKLNSKQL